MRMFRDFPRLTSTVLGVVVIGHLFLARRLDALDLPGQLLAASTPEALLAIALGVAGLAALVGGFAGVVIVFGVGTEHPRFRLLRQRGGGPLAANWISVVVDALLSAFMAITAAVTIAAGQGRAGLWLAEVALLLAAHGSIRLVWLLSQLVRVVGAHDADEAVQQRVVPSDNVVRRLG